MEYTPEPLVVECDSCHKKAETYDYQHPDLAVECGCCPESHDHAGLGCRPVTITATARLVLFEIGQLLDAAGIPYEIEDLEEAYS